MRILGFVIATMAFVCCANAGDFSWGDCSYPDPQKMVGKEIEKAEFRIFSLPEGAARWLLVSWDGPKGGLVDVLACDGHAVANLGLGYFDQAMQGPIVNGRATLEVLYVPATGSGINLQSVALLQFDGKAVSVLWDHLSRNINSFPNALDGGAADDERWRTTTDVFRWEYTKNGTEIRVTGSQKNELGKATRTHKLRPERYCLQPSTHKFATCKAP